MPSAVGRQRFKSHAFHFFALQEGDPDCITLQPLPLRCMRNSCTYPSFHFWHVDARACTGPLHYTRYIRKMVRWGGLALAKPVPHTLALAHNTPPPAASSGATASRFSRTVRHGIQDGVTKTLDEPVLCNSPCVHTTPISTFLNTNFAEK